MSSRRRVRSASFVAPVLAAAIVHGLAAQQLVTVGVEGVAAGLDAFNNPAITCVRVADGPVLAITFHAGDSAAVVAQRLASGLLAQGVSASVAGDLLVVASDQNGAPLTRGVDFATNDLGHTGIVAQLDRVGPGGAVKTSGLTLPWIVGGQIAVDGTIGVDVDVEIPGAGGVTLVRTSLAVPVFAGWGPPQVASWLQTQLLTAGLAIQSQSQIPSVLDAAGALHTHLQLDRDANGRAVRRIAYRPLVPSSNRRLEVHPGRDPHYGTADYGEPSNHGLGQPLFAVMAQSPGVHQAAFVEVHSAPNRIAIVMLGWNRAALPMPFVSPSALLLVDPTDALLSYGVTDAAGIFTHVTPPPNDPAFAGFRAWFQAADLQGADLTQLRLSQGLATALYPF